MALQYKLSKVGFPIRKSADQRLFAPPHSLSQRTTSFIASQRQGIHRMLLRHLIVPMINVRHPKMTFLIRKTNLHVDHNHSSEGKRSRARPDAVLGDRLAVTISLYDNKQLNIALSAWLAKRNETWTLFSGWVTGGAYRDRTDDLMLAKHALSQLS